MTELSFCEGYWAGKLCRKPFSAVGEIRLTRKLRSNGNTVEVLDKFKEFEVTTTNHIGRAIATLRTDNGDNYLSIEFQNYLKEKGIRRDLTVPQSSQQNAVSEWMNQPIIESARSTIAHVGLSRNHLPTMALKENETPYERWYGKKPDVSHFRVFGCMAYAHVPDGERRKLDKKSKNMRFAGYSLTSKGYHSLTSKGYRLFDETDWKLYIRRDAEFNETNFGQKQTMTTKQTKRARTGSRMLSPLRKMKK